MTVAFRTSDHPSSSKHTASARSSGLSAGAAAPFYAPLAPAALRRGVQNVLANELKPSARMTGDVQRTEGVAAKGGLPDDLRDGRSWAHHHRGLQVVHHVHAEEFRVGDVLSCVHVPETRSTDANEDALLVHVT
jgi:hypothetical protein